MYSITFRKEFLERQLCLVILIQTVLYTIWKQRQQGIFSVDNRGSNISSWYLISYDIKYKHDQMFCT